MPEQSTTKTCCRCRQDLPLDAFRKGVGTYGREGYCKPCRVDYQREWQQRNREKVRASQRRSKARYPERNAARTKVKNAIRDGYLARAEACERCGTVCKTNAHHADYSKPLDVEWLCRKCHCAEHAEEAA